MIGYNFFKTQYFFQKKNTRLKSVIQFLDYVQLAIRVHTGRPLKKDYVQGCPASRETLSIFDKLCIVNS